VTRILLPLLLVALLAGCGSGGVETNLDPTYRVRGTLVEADGSAASEASIVLERSPIGALTGGDGAFDLGPLHRGNYEVRLLYLGYRSRPGALAVPGEGGGTLTFPMFPVPGKQALVDSLPPMTVTWEVVRVH
jgi:hypothetical protein